MPHDKDKDYSYTKVEDPTIIFEKILIYYYQTFMFCYW